MEEKIQLASQFLELVMAFNEEVRDIEDADINFGTTNFEGKTHITAFVRETDPILRDNKSVFKHYFFSYFDEDSIEEIIEGIQPFIDYMTNFKEVGDKNENKGI